jgi:hypothetical protein
VQPLAYLDYERSRDVPNIIVDGPPNESTVLTLSHWPGVVAPARLKRDLSAQMVDAYLDHPVEHPPARVVSNNHLDQDGLVSAYAMIHPEEAQRHRSLLLDVAAAGDFATYRDRRAARASMTIACLARIETAGDDDPTDRLYQELLPQLMSIALDNDRYCALWADEDAALTASEQAVESGAVSITERPDLDLAIVSIDADEPVREGHRFGHSRFDGLHPMAIHNATDQFRLLVLHGRRYRFVDRYETWVQYQSRPTAPRIDMRPLADRLTELETGTTVWTGGDPNDLVPTLQHDGESAIDSARLTELITESLV